jgi:hypothetical protein
VLYVHPQLQLASQNYNLTPGVHDKQSDSHSGQLTGCSFLTRELLSDIY